MQKILEQLIENYSYFLFDFDGLLMDSEPLHFNAYKKAFADFNLHLADNFEEFVKMAHADAAWLKTIEKNNPHIHGKISLIKEHKHALFSKLIEVEKASLMPGVAELLETLTTQRIPSCVVTNSKREHILIMKKPHSILNSIENWVCREDYKNPKPAPDGYLKAISFHPNKKIIGFEDTLKGVDSLKAAGVKPVLVSRFLNSSVPGHIHLKSLT